MTSAPRIVAPWLKEAQRAFESAHGPRSMIQVTIRDPHDARARLVYYVPATALDQKPQAPSVRLKGLQRRILGAVGRDPRPAKVIAHKLGKRLDSHFYAALRALCRHDPPVLLRGADGYYKS